MSTETIHVDPAIVREIAETAHRSTTGASRAERVEAALIASGVAGPVVGERFDMWTRAVAAEYERLESIAIAREANEAAAHVERFAARWEQIQPDGSDMIDGFPGVDIKLKNSHLRALLKGRAADTHAIAALMDAAGGLPIPQLDAMPELRAALNALYELFEDRINEHDKNVRFARLVPVVGEDAARVEVYGDKADI